MPRSEQSHRYWNKQYWAMVQREQEMAATVAGLIENQAAMVWRMIHSKKSG